MVKTMATKKNSDKNNPIERFIITEYSCGASAYQSPNNKNAWTFVIEILSGKRQHF